MRHTCLHIALSTVSNRFVGVFLPILFLAAAPFTAGAQENSIQEYREATIQPRPIDRPTWRRTIEGLDYSSKPEAEATPKERQPRNPQPQQKKDSSNSLFNRDWGLSGRIFEIIGKIILIAASAAVLFLLLRSLLTMEWAPRNKKINKEEPPAIDIEKVEENIEAFDLDDLIRQALATRQYPLALRLYYLSTLKELSRSRLIRWRKGKTNRDYLHEMEDNYLRSEFQRLTHAFEQIWYGQHVFNEKDYQKLAPHFKRFVTDVRERRSPTTEESL